MKFEYLKTAWLVLAMALVFGAMLAGVQIGLKPVIEENKRAETFGQVPVLIAGANPDGTSKEIIGPMIAYRAVDESGRVLGWVATAKGSGYGGAVEVLIGLDPDARTIKGLYVLSHTETPGLGDFITGQKFRSYFIDQGTAEPLVVVKTDPTAGQVEAITGATVSSEAVVGIVNKAVAQFKTALAIRQGEDQ